MILKIYFEMVGNNFIIIIFCLVSTTFKKTIVVMNYQVRKGDKLISISVDDDIKHNVMMRFVDRSMHFNSQSD